MMPELASLKIVAFEEGGKFIGHRVIPIIAVHSGRFCGNPFIFCNLETYPFEHLHIVLPCLLCRISPVGSGAFRFIRL